MCEHVLAHGLNKSHAEFFINHSRSLSHPSLAAASELDFPIILLRTAQSVFAHDPAHPDIGTLVWAIDHLFDRFRLQFNAWPLPETIAILAFFLDTPHVAIAVRCLCILSKCDLLTRFIADNPALVTALCGLAVHSLDVGPCKILKLFNYSFAGCCDEAAVRRIAGLYGYMARRGSTAAQRLALHGFLLFMESREMHIDACFEENVSEHANLAIADATADEFIVLGLRILGVWARHREFGQIDLRCLFDHMGRFLKSRSTAVVKRAIVLIRRCWRAWPDFADGVRDQEVLCPMLELVRSGTFEIKVISAEIVVGLIEQGTVQFLADLVAEGVVGCLLDLLGQAPAQIEGRILAICGNVLRMHPGAGRDDMAEHIDAIEAVADDLESPSSEFARHILALFHSELPDQDQT
jgi:hypothetical protein